MHMVSMQPALSRTSGAKVSSKLHCDQPVSNSLREKPPMSGVCPWNLTADVATPPTTSMGRANDRVQSALSILNAARSELPGSKKRAVPRLESAPDVIRHIACDELSCSHLRLLTHPAKEDR